MVRHPDLIVGLGGADDAAVYRLDADTAIAQTVDFFTPIVDDAYDWGRIVAANALSDIYAMGATPMIALQIAGWPRDSLPLELLSEVFAGGADVLRLARCTLVGGHSIDDTEPKYGFAVTGLVPSARIVTNAGAKPGDFLVLTKPLGSGILSTAIKRDLATAEQQRSVVATMTQLNAGAAEVMTSLGVHAATDITGYGLIGHLGEITVASRVGASLSMDAIPLLDGVRDLAAQGVVPGGSHRNRSAADEVADLSAIGDVDRIVVTDAQTSGGLLMAVPPARVERLVSALEDRDDVQVAAIIGEVTDGDSIVVT